MEIRFNPQGTLGGTCSDVTSNGITAYFEEKS